MMHFGELINRGARVAAMSDRDEGNCRAHHPSGVEGQRRFCDLCGIDYEHLILPRQTHSDTVRVVTVADRGRGTVSEGFAETDALITNMLETPIGVTIADCVPVMLFDTASGSIGIAHAGRVGTFLRIAAKTVEAMVRAFGAAPESMHAVIGPSAGPETYEVSEETAEEWRASGLPATGRLLDLWDANRQQLEACGIPGGNIRVSGCCTIRESRFYSHRKGDSERNLAVMML